MSWPRWALPTPREADVDRDKRARARAAGAQSVELHAVTGVSLQHGMDCCALFIVEALANDHVIHEAPAIVGRQNPPRPRAVA
jgi:hypothetical protein